jgi:hypothetical protein
VRYLSAALPSSGEEAIGGHPEQDRCHESEWGATLQEEPCAGHEQIPALDRDAVRPIRRRLPQPRCLSNSPSIPIHPIPTAKERANTALPRRFDRGSDFAPARQGGRINVHSRFDRETI